MLHFCANWLTILASTMSELSQKLPEKYAAWGYQLYFLTLRQRNSYFIQNPFARVFVKLQKRSLRLAAAFKLNNFRKFNIRSRRYGVGRPLH